MEQVELVSPSFVRITFGGADLAQLGNPGATFDQRIKLIFPPESGLLPRLHEGDDWYRQWGSLPETERGSMRTYSIRHLHHHGAPPKVAVDFVLHLVPGLTGPASSWAAAAAPGDELVFIGPRRGSSDWGGVEFLPGRAGTVLLAGDETAAPAIARTLEDLPAEVAGTAFIEVPRATDALPIDAPAGVEVRWLAREGAEQGGLLIPAVLDHLGASRGAEGVAVRDVESEQLPWETPSFSALGEDVPEPCRVADSERYFWIAGESAVVTTLRRHLVRDLGVDRAQVAFMGYWRRGVTMKG